MCKTCTRPVNDMYKKDMYKTCTTHVICMYKTIIWHAYVTYQSKLKVAALAYSFKLEVHTIAALIHFLMSFVSITTDMGTELGVSRFAIKDIRDSLPQWLIAGTMEQDGDLPFEESLPRRLLLKLGKD